MIRITFLAAALALTGFAATPANAQTASSDTKVVPGGQAALTEALLQTVSAVAGIVAILGRVSANSRIA